MPYHSRMPETSVTLATPDGDMEAFFAAPDSADSAPGIVVAQEAFGVNGHVRNICRKLAKEGFAALAPELYHRDGRGLVFPY